MTEPAIENAIAVLGASDLARSIEFYRATLGFETEWNAGSTCSVSRDGCSIMLQERREIAPGTVWIGVADEAMIRRVEQSGAEVLQRPARQPWAYEMRIADPDGNVIWLGANPRHAPA